MDLTQIEDITGLSWRWSRRAYEPITVSVIGLDTETLIDKRTVQSETWYTEIMPVLSNMTKAQNIVLIQGGAQVEEGQPIGDNEVLVAITQRQDYGGTYGDLVIRQGTGQPIISQNVDGVARTHPYMFSVYWTRAALIGSKTKTKTYGKRFLTN